MRRVIVIAVSVFVVGGVGTLGWWLWRDSEAIEITDARIPGEGYSPEVEVLNGAGIDGLAAATTRRLRRQGIDVVYYGTAATDSHTVTQLLIRRGDTAAAGYVRRALGFGRLIERPDPTRLVDVTVLLGRDARAAGLRP